jgi:hypothetical protein
MLSCADLQCPAMSCAVLHCPTLSCCPHFLYCPALSCTVPIVLHSPALPCTVPTVLQSCTVMQCHALSRTVLRCPELPCTVRHLHEVSCKCCWTPLSNMWKLWHSPLRHSWNYFSFTNQKNKLLLTFYPLTRWNARQTSVIIINVLPDNLSQ